MPAHQQRNPPSRTTDLEPGDRTPSSFTLSNARLQLVIDRARPAASPASLSDTNTEYLAPHACGNQLQTFTDTPKQYDAWNIDPGTLDGPMTPIDHVDSIAITDNGPLRKTIRITRTWSKSQTSSRTSPSTPAPTSSASTTTSTGTRPTSSSRPPSRSPPPATKPPTRSPTAPSTAPPLRNNSWEKAKFEVPALRWADLGDAHQGVSILNDSKYGYDAVGNTLRLTLLRSPTWPDPDADRGHQHFTYAHLPPRRRLEAGPDRAPRLRAQHPLTAQQVFAHTGTLPATHSFASVDNPNVTLTAVKKAEDADALIFRMYEWAGKRDRSQTPRPRRRHLRHRNQPDGEGP